ncbi:formylglycine-generating enzyme family protein [Engelhardtia mirabilis]|uniref:formylglycine-generating enzyme family protein n=1 Tax=Engelhardtia mirabilis TaxID=2528011 RepID=UPI003AF3FCB3
MHALAAVGLAGIAAACAPAPAQPGSSAGEVATDAPVQAGEQSTAPAPSPAGMVWVPPGRFNMGWDGPEARADERPGHPVQLDGFWIDSTEVTNAQFAQFVDATGYVTIAERAPDWEELKAQLPPGTPEPPPGVLVPGSLVFTPPSHAVYLDDVSQWWTWTPGASWRHPEGPGSSIEGRERYPVVHVAWDDAVSFAAWAGKRLPTEAEWERAARFGHDGQRFAWGDELEPGGRHLANIWQGKFPHHNEALDGFVGAAPVGSFPPSELGLFDMSGNVWEWTADRFDPGTYGRRVAETEPGTCCSNPTGPARAADPRNPLTPDSRVQKGGSFLCHASYCSSYRPSAKMASSPDSGLSHLGFRCVTTPQLWAARPAAGGQPQR